MVQPTLIVTFENVTEALKLEGACKAAALKGRLIPTPRALSASCALSWRCAPELEEQIRLICSRQGITYADLRLMDL